MANPSQPAAPSGQRFVQANMVVRARTLTKEDRAQYNIPATAAPDAIGIFSPSTGELINTMGAEQFHAFYHDLDGAAPAGGAPAGNAQPATQQAPAGEPGAEQPAAAPGAGPAGAHGPA